MPENSAAAEKTAEMLSLFVQISESVYLQLRVTDFLQRKMTIQEGV